MVRVVNFPKEIICPNCKKELEVEGEERFSEKIICPVCNTEIIPGKINLPSTEQPPETIPKDLSKRGGCLTAFLIGMMVCNPLLGIYYIAIADTVYKNITHDSAIITLLLIVLPFANLLFAIFLWNWKKAGFIGVWVNSIIATIINVIVGVPGYLIIAGLAGPIILTILYNKEKEKFN